jgi:hypothetical protein
MLSFRHTWVFRKHKLLVIALLCYADRRLRSTLVDHENRAVIGMIPEEHSQFVRR